MSASRCRRRSGRRSSCFATAGCWRTPKPSSSPGPSLCFAVNYSGTAGKAGGAAAVPRRRAAGGLQNPGKSEAVLLVVQAPEAKPEAQRLCRDGEALEDSKTLAELKLDAGSVLGLVYRQEGRHVCWENQHPSLGHISSESSLQNLAELKLDADSMLGLAYRQEGGWAGALNLAASRPRHSHLLRGAFVARALDCS